MIMNASNNYTGSMVPDSILRGLCRQLCQQEDKREAAARAEFENRKASADQAVAARRAKVEADEAAEAMADAVHFARPW
jgi:hypothetical protein